MNRRLRGLDIAWVAKCPRCGWEDGAGSRDAAVGCLIFHLRTEHQDLKFWIEDADGQVSEVVAEAGLREDAQLALPMA